MLLAPVVVFIPLYVWFVWFMLRRRTLQAVFDEIRKTKRTYVLNDEGTAYVLKK